MPGFNPNDPRDVATYDEVSLWSAMAGLLLLDHVPLGAHRMLDLGCGAGFPLLELAERLGPQAYAVGADPWRAALECAGEKRQRWPVANAALARADGAALPFRDGAFDLAVSSLGLNNFADPDAALAECHRVLAPGGTLALSTNLTGHWREFYAAFAAALNQRGDRAALARLAHHVAHRGTIEGLTRRLERAGFRVTATHDRVVPMRFADAEALFAHHFIRLGFVPAWESVVEEPARADVFAALRTRLDGIAREHGELRLTVPFACVLAARG